MVLVMFGLLLLVAGAARRLAGVRVSAGDAAVREPA
jgi:hypothetical protein